MVASIKSLSRWALLGMALLVNAQNVPLRIMPLGASITHGVGTDSGNGYRQYLLEHLNGDGFEVDYVGSQSSGTMEDKDNEGYPGKRIEEITTTIGGTLPNLPGPNVYTINAGTNDAIQDFDVNNAGVRMYDMLDYLWSVTPDATVVLSTLIRHLNPDTDARVGNINEQFRGLVWDLANQQGKRIVLAEMHGDDGPQEGDINDDEIHPNEEGFKKMATVWHRSILEANDAGLILPAP